MKTFRIGIFNVVTVEPGGAYGLDDQLINLTEEDLVEFYDSRYANQKTFGPHGQFVTRYNLSVLAGHEDGMGLLLYGGVPAWQLTSDQTHEALVMLGVRTRPLWKRAEFLMDFDGKSPKFVGYHNGNRWNGWACPQFTREVGMAIVAECDRVAKVTADRGADKETLRYDEARDAFLYETEAYPGEPSMYSGRDMQTEDGFLHVYAIGAMEWCWWGPDHLKK